MRNWVDYVGIQDIDHDRDPHNILIYYAAMIEDTFSPGLTFSILGMKLQLEDFYLEKDDLDFIVEEMLDTFPRRVALNEFHLRALQNHVAYKTRRGVANTNYGNTWFYNGSNTFDRPILVANYRNKFAIFKHPDFNKYGFNIVRNKEDET